MDYTVPSIGREFGSVFLGDKNVAMLVVSEGWAKVGIHIDIWHSKFTVGRLNLSRGS